MGQNTTCNFDVRATGDLFDFAHEASAAEGKLALVCPVNCVPGVMGKGLALEFADRWPALPGYHKRYAHARALRIGSPVIISGAGAAQTVLFPTKDHWREPSRFPWIVAGLIGLSDLLTIDAIDSPIRTLVFPALGCGLGGLPWTPVVEALEGFAIAHPRLTVIAHQPQRD